MYTHARMRTHAPAPARMTRTHRLTHCVLTPKSKDRSRIARGGKGFENLHLFSLKCAAFASTHTDHAHARTQSLAVGEEIAWNYVEFEVVYHSLDNEIKIGMQDCSHGLAWERACFFAACRSPFHECAAHLRTREHARTHARTVSTH